MIKFKNIFSTFNLLLLFSLLFFACGSDDEGSVANPFPDINKGDIEANRFLLTFTLEQDSSQKETVEFFDPDGIDGNQPPSIADTVRLQGPVTQGAFRRYLSEIEFFDDNTSVNQAIINKDDEYIICYRAWNADNLRSGDRNEDRDGLPFGITAVWSTAKQTPNPPEGGVIRVTLNFQPAGKEGLCDPGVRILDAEIPYLVSN